MGKIAKGVKKKIHFTMLYGNYCYIFIISLKNSLRVHTRVIPTNTNSVLTNLNISHDISSVESDIRDYHSENS